MSGHLPLQGSCSCGRYRYVIAIPEDAHHEAQVQFRTDDQHRRSQAALLTAFLRVPLAWYSSNTVSFFPDETHNSISRTFSPTSEPYCQRKFCGYCGTHLTYWTEEPAGEQEYLHVTLGSLRNRDLDTLQDLDLLPEDVPTRRTDQQDMVLDGERLSSTVATNPPDGVVRTVRRGTDGPLTWFEEMLDGSRLGRTRQTRRGVGTSADGTTSVSWEVSEYVDDGDVIMTAATTGPGSKRKLGEVADELGL